MTLQELEQQVHQLSVVDRWSLLNTITRSPQHDLAQPQDHVQPDKRLLVEQLRGCLKQPGECPPTDEEIDAMREERLVKK